MGPVNKLTSSVSQTISQVTQEIASTQQPAERVSSLGIAANSDAFEVIVASEYDSMRQQRSQVDSIGLTYEKPVMAEASGMFDSLPIIEQGVTVNRGRLKELAERLNSLKERAQDLKQQMTALEEQIKAKEAEGAGGLAELCSRLKKLQSEYADIQNEIKSILNEIQSMEAKAEERLEKNPDGLGSSQMHGEHILETSQAFHTDIPQAVSIDTLIANPDDDDEN